MLGCLPARGALSYLNLMWLSPFKGVNGGGLERRWGDEEEGKEGKL